MQHLSCKNVELLSYIKLLIVWQLVMVQKCCYLHFTALSLLGSVPYNSLKVIKLSEPLSQ